jgi:flagellar biosynthesis/type III secretory pathway chaperone
MESRALADLSRKELAMLKEFLGALTAERESIISFSLEGIVRENNRKEEILKRLEFIEAEKEKLFSSTPDLAALTETASWNSLTDEIQENVRDVRIALEKNMKLLSFSMDHVTTSLEKIIDFINKTSYQKGRGVSVMVSRKI